MSTDWTSKAKHITTVEWASFNRVTGVASNIDAVISACGGTNVSYGGGDLRVANRAAADGDWVGKDGADTPVNKTAAEVALSFTEE